ncbi:helix-turn-helix domain-containing protein [Chloroflexota bacterium]
MLLKSRVLDFCNEKYMNLSELAQAMGISVSQVYRMREGKCHIDEEFIVGAMRAFPEYRIGELFYFTS